MEEFVRDNLLGTTWYGEVVDNEDPTFNGRIRVKVFGKFDDIPVNSIPWAISGNISGSSNETGGSTHSVPKLKSIVRVTFENGNLYTPIYYSNLYYSAEVVQEIKKSYKNSHVWCYDTEANPGPIKIYYTEQMGYMIDSNKTTININADSEVIVTHKDNKSVVNIKENQVHIIGKNISFESKDISVGSKDKSTEPAVLGDKNAKALQEISTELSKLTATLTTFMQVQSKVAKAVVTTKHLEPGFTAPIPTLQSITSKIQSKIMALSIPQTKSKVVTLD